MFRYALLLIVPTLIVAQDRFEQTAGEMFDQSDLNNDGKVTPAEFQEDFLRFDQDDDTIISRHEFTKHFDLTVPELHHVAHSLFDVYDQNNDHRLEYHDFDILLQIIDSDGNGEANRHEWVRYFAIILAELDHFNPSS